MFEKLLQIYLKLKNKSLEWLKEMLRYSVDYITLQVM